MGLNKNVIFSVGLLLMIASLLFTGASPAAYAASENLFVIPNGRGACSQADPGGLQTALGLASDGDTIYLAHGTYTGTGDAVITITKSITIRGGWDGEVDAQPVCDSAASPSTIDGEGKRRGVYITGDIAPSLQGLHIIEGNATGLGGYEYPAGSTYDAGGGVYINTASATLRDNIIFGNTAPEGAGVFLGNSSSTLEHNQISNNIATDTGGGLFVYKGAPTLSGNVISSNTAQSSGGGGGSGIYLFSSPLSLTDNTIADDDSAAHGGGVSVASCSPNFTGNLIIDNAAAWRGGGISLWYSKSSLINNVIAGNRVTAPVGVGSGLWVGGSKPHLAHTTIARNTGGDGSGIYVTDGGSTHSSVSMVDTILVGHKTGIIVTAGSSATLEGTLWGSGAWDSVPWVNDSDWDGDGAVVTGNINIWGDPSFVNPAGGDYHIGPKSAAIDAGVDAGITHDIDGDPRPIGPAFDIGADEADH